MKNIKQILVFLTYSALINAQEIKIDSTNYCKFYDETAHYRNSDVKSFNLTRTMIIDIVQDEMIKLGFKWVNNFRIIKIDSDNYITSICYSDKSNCGFLFDNIFSTSHTQEDRNLKSLSKKHSIFDYGEKIVFLDGSYKFVNIKDIPKNLHILKLNDYWYQESTNKEKNKKLISKDFIVELLRNDVRQFLKGFKP